jgi:acyl carrier protein
VNPIQDEVRTFIIETFLFGSGGETLKNDASLLEQGIIDSTGVLELVNFLENTYGIEVEDEELHPDNLDSIERIEAYVVRKQNGPA